jgi:hypothetical protein
MMLAADTCVGAGKRACLQNLIRVDSNSLSESAVCLGVFSEINFSTEKEGVLK